MFQHQLIDFEPLEQITSPSGRLYVTPEGNSYPSVTTIIGSMSDKTWLNEWRERVGVEQANRTAGHSANRGTAVHLLCEKYVLNQEIDLKREMPLNKKIFFQMKDLLINVDNIYSSEARLYSDKLKVAGTVDLVGQYKGVDSIIDFKTSTGSKSREDIAGYFIQVAIYAYMFWERTGILCKQLVIMIGVEEGNSGQIYIDKTANWITEAANMCKQFHIMKEEQSGRN